MSTRRSRFFLSTAILVLVVTPLSAEADGGPPPFASYTPAARAEIEKLLATLERLKTYSDEGEVRDASDSMPGRKGEAASTVIQSPDHFRVESSNRLMVSDGANVVIVRKTLRRYVRMPVGDDWQSVVERSSRFGWNEIGSVGDLWLAKDRRAYIAEKLARADVRGREIVDGELCVVVEGVVANFTVNGESLKSRWFLRERDALVRRIVTGPAVDATEASVGDPSDGVTSTRWFAPDFSKTYDVKAIRVDSELPRDAFVFQPKRGWKQAARFYDRFTGGTQFDGQIPLSGRPMPPFELRSADGFQVSSGILTGKVGLLYFVPQQPMSPDFEDERLGELWGLKIEHSVGEFPSDQVTVLYVFSGEAKSPVVTKMVERGLGARLLLDPNGTLRSRFLDAWDPGGIVLVGRDSMVQGLRPAWCTGELNTSLKSDIEALLSGATLPIAVPMSDEETEEMRHQQRAAPGLPSAEVEPIGEELLHRAWSVRVESRSWVDGSDRRQRDPVSSGLWVRGDRSLRQISPDGKVVDQVPFASRSRDYVFDESLAIARARHGRLVITLGNTAETVKVGLTTTSRPGQPILQAWNEEGEQEWELQLGDAGRGPSPGNLAVANLDGRNADEIVFTHAGAIWIVDTTGEVLVGKPLDGYTSWIRVQDLDGDDKAEVYVRYSDSLDRFDYLPSP